MKTVRILTNEEMTPTTRKARVLLQALKEKGISFGIISERLGYHFTWASHVRRGQHQVSTNILDKLQSMVDNEDPSLVTAKISEDKVSPITSDLILSLFSNRTKYTITDITRRLASKRIANGNIQMTVYRLRKTGKLIYSHRRYSLPSTPKSENAIARLDASTIIDPVVIDPLLGC